MKDEFTVGLYLHDKGYEGLNLTQPNKGNPGIGGTQYMFLMLAYYLCLHYTNIKVVIFHYNSSNTLIQNAYEEIVDNELDVLLKARENKVDLLIHDTNKSFEWYKTAEKNSVPLIVWAHCYLNYPEIDFIVKSQNVKKVVFVGKQEYDRYIDDPIIQKSTYIFNMFFNENRSNIEKKRNIVVFMGSLNKEKGFHVLAKNWPKIVKKVPDAELWVVGSGALYSRENELGRFNIAEANYEQTFMKYLTKNGEVISSVKFLGILGEDKSELLKKCKVGIVNPTAISETFCLSAIEMESLGIPIVTKRKFGLCDTVKNKLTGRLFYFQKDFSRYVVKLLKDDMLNEKYGKAGISFVNEMFDPNLLIKKWYELFNRIDLNEKYIPPNDYWTNDGKFIRLINRKINGLIHGRSLVFYKYKIKQIIKNTKCKKHA